MVKKHISLILIVMLLATALVGCGEKAPAYKDGTYEGEAKGMEPLKVSVEVKDGKIANVEVTEQNETEGFAEPALEQIPKAIVDKNSTEVDAVSGATVTSNAIKEAVNNALEGAK
ncbi:FMN-binding protein [Lachnospiraceae bacterium NSJ-29]|uniref:FMN-binding protein n=1 Tax=Wansuia hejianensis TaxID=2763667 RepID=A0A926IN82_9FIRM|nr:FMN-binding protein [Wansuia hejianensis]MBC8591210.1 FMN-binding protein [Wansuia hejianensis]